MAVSTHGFTLSQSERTALNVSLGVGIAMLAIKWFAYLITGSVAIFSDAMESVVHQFAVAFAWYSLRVSYRPPDSEHNYGHDKITYFSAGFEGGLIIVAAGVIIVSAVLKLIHGTTIEDLGVGTMLTGSAGAINAVLGWYLVRVGKRTRSLIVEANGRHILTDAWTSAGAVVALLIVWKTGLTVIDPLLALFFGANIIREGGKLLRAAVSGLMDSTNPHYYEKAFAALEGFTQQNGVSFHRLRLRESGQRVYVDFHLLFPDGTLIENAHTIATNAERCVLRCIDLPAEVMSHLESMSGHSDHHDDEDEITTED